MSIAVAIAVVAVGLLVGVLSGFFGVGGGILMVPFIVLALGKSPQLAEGTSLLVIIPTAAAGVLAHRRAGLISFRHAALLATGGIGGALVGAALALRLPGETLEAAFGVFLGLMGLRTVLQGCRRLAE